MGFDANQFRAQHAKPESDGGSLVNIALAGLLGLGVLAVAYMYFANIKRNNAHSDTLHAARLARVDGSHEGTNQGTAASGLRSSSASQKRHVKANSAPRTPNKVRTTNAAQLTYAAQIDAEMKKFTDTSSILRSCGKRTEYAYRYYGDTNQKKYSQLWDIRKKLPKQKIAKGESIVPSSMEKSWDRLGKIKDEKDVAVFLLKGGAIKHQIAAMEMMSNMQKMDQNFRNEKKQRAAARTPKACMALGRKVQQGKMDIKIPRKKRR